MTDTVISKIEEIIDAAKNGRMFILVDDENRENEGDLIIPAQMATPDAVNFMARYGRGLICLAVTSERASELKLDPMSPKNETKHETAFTVSIEAKHGVSTGISAADRARTIAVAIDARNGPDQIVTPGHVFPLVARDGGVLVRAGHTEAAVDVARLAGLNPSGVICEIMKEDGSMARLSDLAVFAEQHRLKIGTIRDLIAYRRRFDHLVSRVADMPMTSVYGGEWRALVFRNKIDSTESLALLKGSISEDSPTLVRMHSLSIFSDLLGEPGDRALLLQRSMTEIGMAGTGVIVLLSAAESGRSLSAYMSSRTELMDQRSYGVGAQILADLGVHEMVLMSNTPHTLVALEGYGLSVIEERPISGE
ncbi:3,4-dihydroxy-2-butanone-4-phosphate synthase [Tardibacter chloracetimidivorans]|uniref:3,4-dihydroxy-2-butanone 4-phosphate synthase n=1 Tax=Tardibacter chloracetimidivorans TaxID=1921510 RepID=A0A1L3ZVS0_9SPHN|nr:3,4-dihydroxy-2-butanone-4-phosphate synthase [Tardibacter chloracetimidivorans]API59690.1 3,4-dihydroxy-2-butanone-4-phosphate synthase [Tardibacter chloracetimidivorans]